MDGPLGGVVVLDLTRALAGPHAGMMLADLGARVIKIESPDGDESRSWGPPFIDGVDGQRQSTYFMSANRNKESITLDLKTPEGCETLQRLVRHADVLLENFRRGVLDRLGFGVRQLQDFNPRLIVLSITGFGHDGPDADRPGYDQIAQGEAGLMSLTGPDPDQPTRIGVPIGDLLAGMYGAFGVLAALYERQRTGCGRVVRTSLLAAIIGVHAFQGTRYTVAGEVPQPQGNHHPSIAPYGMFRAADGNLQVAVGSDAQWVRFAGVLGLDHEDPRFTSNRQRVTNHPELIEEIERSLSKEPVDHWLPRLTDAGVPAGVVRSLEQVYEWEQTRSQGLVIAVDHPAIGPLELPGPPLRFDGWVKVAHSAPPLLGEHNGTVASWLDAMDAHEQS